MFEDCPGCMELKNFGANVILLTNHKTFRFEVKIPKHLFIFEESSIGTGRTTCILTNHLRCFSSEEISTLF